MKKTITLMVAVACILLIADSTNSQNINETADPDCEKAEASGIFEAKRLNNAVLIPRMRHSRMLAISSPAKGLMVCNIVDKRFYYFDGDFWIGSCISCDYPWPGNTFDTHNNLRRNAGISTFAYSTGLKTYKIYTDGLSEGVFMTNGKPSLSGVGTSMWYPDKTAGSAGYVEGLQSNKENLEYFSIAMRLNAIPFEPIPMQWIGRQWFEEEVPFYMNVIYLFLDIASLIW